MNYVCSECEEVPKVCSVFKEIQKALLVLKAFYRVFEVLGKEEPNRGFRHYDEGFLMGEAPAYNYFGLKRITGSRYYPNLVKLRFMTETEKKL